MLNNLTHSRLHELGLNGMAKALVTVQRDGIDYLNETIVP